ncbi:hypothetical protein N7517_009904 [Penicillium concentricum]|uniref:Helicase ATP-binding domain-containing protein n=1 Tax=Penicillium concentricum TaxID=293559 RepID=A0A9W9UX18_9EURO|nr:uncharacterized protein N7517_009904 [Penicillium concentricum]KAJ5360713.1 hypothetical protein N7517_009904 [Penicillium concentricum]
MPPFRFQYGHQPKEQVRPANQEIRQYYDPDLPVYGPWKLWQTKPELPSAEEILGTDVPGDVVALAPNCISGPWVSKEKYLEAHYALIREDSVAPLRNAVGRVRAEPFMRDTPDISIYEKIYELQIPNSDSSTSKVFIIGVTLARSGFALHIQFSTRRAGKNIAWTYSNRLNPGTVVALTPKQNAFLSKCVVAVVACRLQEGVEKDPPRLISSWPRRTISRSTHKWIMVEARAGYFEANRHTLTALQKLSKESFPLNEQICSLAGDIDAPEYVNTAPCMDFTPLSEVSVLDITGKYDILERWPSQPMGRLDASQWSALNRMLTKKLAIIQGPPGTGKTFTSIAALKMMLSGKRSNDPPIIIAAQTNHALDQLIKHISVFEKNYVRLGGRTTDPEIRKRTPYEIRQTQGLLKIEGGLLTPMIKKQNKLAGEIGKLLEPFAPSNSNKPLAASLFREHGVLSEEQVNSLEEVAHKWQQYNAPANADPLMAWLTDSVREFDYKYVGGFGFIDDDIDREYEQLKEIEVEHGRYEDDWSDFKTRFFPLSPGLCGSNNGKISRATVEILLKEKDLYNIHKRYRGAVYCYMRKQLIAIMGEYVHRLAQSYKDCSSNVQIGRFERDYCILQEARIIGMTTTGLSKYRGLVSSLNPQVILIEEAAEVLEAPVAVACLPSLQHLILVGDHLQLKGQCADYELCGHPFYLDLSMFERLVVNKMPYAMLQEQRRMVPEIRKLVAPIYGDRLRDHPSVEDHPLVPGMGEKRSFFFDHTSSESADSLLSKVNEFEASMVVNLLAYLVMNKVPTTSITVLTFYNGQRKLIMRKKAKNLNVAQTYVNILTVDSYQGEENDIVILSLVRSNFHRGIGFLEQDNRVCVALSRAKYGLYIFGNAQCVSKHSSFWNAVTNVMSEDPQDPRLGPALPLYCARHNQETLIETLKDWNTISDGCSKPCGKDLPCGHPCPRKCHGSEHDWVSCKQRCSEIRECCNKPCICVCSPPHTHDCLCDMGKESKTQVFDAGADWNDVGEDDDRDAVVGPITRPQAPARTPAFTFSFVKDEDKSQFAHGVRRWQAFAQGGAIVDDYRRAKLHVRGNHSPGDDTPVEKNAAAAPVEGGPISFDEYRRAKLLLRGKRPQQGDTPVEKNVAGPVEGDLINFVDNPRVELPFRGKRPRIDTMQVKKNVVVEGDLINFGNNRQAELPYRGKRPRTDTTTVGENVTVPVEGDLINFDDDDDPKTEVQTTGEDKPTAPAKEDTATYDGAGDGQAEATSEVKNKPLTPLVNDLIAFEEDYHCRIKSQNQEVDLLTAAVGDDDNMAGSLSLADVSLTPMVNELLLSPVEGELIELF